MAHRRKVHGSGSPEIECYYCNATIPERSMRCPSCGKVFSSTKKLLAIMMVVIIIAASVGFYAYVKLGSHEDLPNGLSNDLDGDGITDDLDDDDDGDGILDVDDLFPRDPTNGGGPVSGKKIKFQLYENYAPNTCQNFKRYANDGFYSGTIFHRVIDGFMIQGGGFEPGMLPKTATYAPINLEISPNLRHEDGSVAMARTNDPNSATSQFYICDGPQSSLDDNYAVFGKVVEGMNYVREISAVSTGTVGSYQDVPSSDVIIESLTISTEGGSTYATITVNY